MRVDVRCCCQPTKLLGSVLVPLPKVEPEQRVTFSLRGGGTITLTIAEWQEGQELYDGTWWRRGGLAFRSDDTPLAVLRRIPGFEEDRWAAHTSSRN